MLLLFIVFQEPIFIYLPAESIVSKLIKKIKEELKITSK